MASYELKTLLIAGVIALIACGSHEKQESSDPATVALPDSAAMPRVQNSDSSGITSRDSALTASEDSILDVTDFGKGVLPNGDTIKSYLDGEMMDGGSSKVYGYDHYRKNSTQYLRIVKIVGRKPNGDPISRTALRLRLPPADSAGRVTEGLCLVNGKPDRSILAIVDSVGESWGTSDHFPARHAWRFDQANETLREIPAAGVRCALPYHSELD